MPSSPRIPSNLPVVILRMIFTYHVELHNRLMESLYSFGSFPSWISITYVCRHWRAVALNHRSLWVTITSELGLGWIKASMERSKPLPIDVSLFTFNPWPPKMDVVINLIRDCMRLRPLYISGGGRHIVKILKALDYQISIHTLSLRSDFGSTPIELPVAMFGRQAPIRTLSFNSDTYFLAPHWFLLTVTLFT